jgi:hypothetical protein
MIQIGTVLISLPPIYDERYQKFVDDSNPSRLNFMKRYGFNEYSDEKWKEFKLIYKKLFPNRKYYY